MMGGVCSLVNTKVSHTCSDWSSIQVSGTSLRMIWVCYFRWTFQKKTALGFKYMELAIMCSWVSSSQWKLSMLVVRCSTKFSNFLSLLCLDDSWGPSCGLFFLVKNVNGWINEKCLLMLCDHADLVPCVRDLVVSDIFCVNKTT